MSTVNRQWSKFVGKRPQVGKLKLAIDHDDLYPESKEILMKSERKYQNINIYDDNGEDNGEFTLSVLAKGAGSWKYLSTFCGGPQDWLKILQIVEPSIEHLDITDANNPKVPTSLDLKFPHLKILEIFENEGQEMLKHFGRVTSLVKFSWCCFEPTEEDTLDVTTLLRNNKDLKEVHVAFVEDLSFLDRLSGIKFKLQKLTIDVPHEPSFRPESLLPLSLLKTQAETLEALETDFQVNQALLEVILGMPRLKLLKVYEVVGEIQELPVNSMITSLEVKGGITAGDEVGPRGRAAYRKVIRAMRSLKHIESKEIDNELFIFLTHDVPDLESIKIHFFNVSAIPERIIFPNIKKFIAWKFNEDLQVPTGDDNFAQLLRRQMPRFH